MKVAPSRLPTKEMPKKKDNYKIRLTLEDEKGKVIAKHDLVAGVVLAFPSDAERERLPKDPKGGFPIVSYQLGSPQEVVGLLNFLRHIIPQFIQNQVDESLAKEDQIILPKGVKKPNEQPN
jgi:hypothetical protein